MKIWDKCILGRYDMGHGTVGKNTGWFRKKYRMVGHPGIHKQKMKQVVYLYKLFWNSFVHKPILQYIVFITKIEEHYANTTSYFINVVLHFQKTGM